MVAQLVIAFIVRCGHREILHIDNLEPAARFVFAEIDAELFVDGFEETEDSLAIILRPFIHDLIRGFFPAPSVSSSLRRLIENLWTDLLQTTEGDRSDAGNVRGIHFYFFGDALRSFENSPGQ